MTTTTAHVIDEETYTLLQEIMADEFAELIDFFRKDAVSALESLQQCVPLADAAQVGTICHKLKSSSKLIGAFHMAELARLLEEYKDDHDQERAQEHLQGLVAEYAQVVQWLDSHQPVSA
jgi:HPt (histidine-containing phosphotransfer) domain-containing protein